MAEPKKSRVELKPLTTIRLFAAVMIVVIHCQDGVFGLPEDFLSDFPLEEGVSLFFVLSGFILYYVYPALPDAAARKRFLLARLARIWPLHLATFLMVIILLPEKALFPYQNPPGEQVGMAVVNLLLLQSWVPRIDYYFSYNAVSWSISTEMFFYVAFLFLVINFSRSWHWKFLSLMLFWVLLFIAAEFLNIPGYRPDYTGVNLPGLFYVNPLARLNEFVTGMIAGLVFQHVVRTGRIEDLRPSTATVLEGLSFAFVIAAMFMVFFYSMAFQGEAGEAGRLWLSNGGMSFFFAALILILAVGRGGLSRVMAHPWLVRGGEISFALYMSHQILIRAYIAMGWREWDLTPFVQVPVAAAIMVAVAWLLWRYVETPARRLILRAFR